jgi:hypothetical protein
MKYKFQHLRFPELVNPVFTVLQAVLRAFLVLQHCSALCQVLLTYIIEMYSQLLNILILYYCARYITDFNS